MKSPISAAQAAKSGDFILKFGHLEYRVAAYVTDRVPSFAKVANKAKFTEGLKAIDEHLVDNGPSGLDAFRQWRKSLEPIRDLRNHIAHGYMFASATENSFSLSICQVNDLDAEPTSKRVTFTDLQRDNAALV